MSSAALATGDDGAGVFPEVAEVLAQTKVVPCKTNKEFLKTLEASWRNCQRLGYIE